MSITQFDRDSMARWYAKEHLKTDPGIESVHYLPADADDRAIRFVEVNTLVVDRTDDALVPIDFGVDSGTESEHTLYVLDVTPDQWARIQAGDLTLPGGWSLDGAVVFEK